LEPIEQLGVAESIKARGLRCDELVYNTLMDGCVKANDVTAGVGLFEEMVQQGLQPSAITHSILARLYGRAGYEDDAHDDYDNERMGLPKRKRLNIQMATPHFGRSSVSDGRSSCALQSPEGRQSTGLEFMSKRLSGHSQNIGILDFSTPSPTQKVVTPECRIGELAWHDQARDLKVCLEEESSPMDEYCGDQAGMHAESEDADEEEGEFEDDEEDEDIANSRLAEPVIVSGEENEVMMLMEPMKRASDGRKGILKSANRKRGS